MTTTYAIDFKSLKVLALTGSTTPATAFGEPQEIDLPKGDFEIHSQNGPVAISSDSAPGPNTQNLVVDFGLPRVVRHSGGRLFFASMTGADAFVEILVVVDIASTW